MPERYGRRVMPSIQRKPPVLPGHSGASQPALGHADPLAISSSVRPEAAIPARFKELRIRSEDAVGNIAWDWARTT
jgi:hypothetical protein